MQTKNSILPKTGSSSMPIITCWPFFKYHTEARSIRCAMHT